MYHRKRKLGRGVAVVGAGMSKFGVQPDNTNRDLVAKAFSEMKASVDKGIDPSDIEIMYLL